MEKQQDDLLLNLLSTPEFIADKEKKILDALEKGIGINAKNKKGETVLMKAVCQKRTALIPLLIEKGADINAKDTDGQTALMEASGRGYTDLALLLIEKGADINAQDTNGRTALMKATENRQQNMIQLLLEKGAKVDIQDNFGHFAFHFAGNPRIKEIFMKARKKSIGDVNTPVENDFSALSKEKRSKTLGTDKAMCTDKAMVTDKESTLKETLVQSELGLSPEWAGLEKDISLTVTGKILKNKGR